MTKQKNKYVTILGLVIAASFSFILGLSLANLSLAQAEEIDDNARPAPPSIGADVPLTYFGPAPSEVQKELVGPHKLLRAGRVDLDAGTITLPLYQGRMESGESVWYIVTDTNDKGNADALGLNFSPKLTFSNVGKAVRQARLDKDFTLVFANGKVDFAPERKVVPGDTPNFFPPKEAHPGSVGDADYSPLVKITNAGGHIYNAPVIAFDVDADELQRYCHKKPDYKVVHDKVLSICPDEAEVVIELTPGFSFARPVLYISTDANHPVPATLEGATYTPALGDIVVGGDDSLFSPVERIFVMINGITGKGNPQRQGLNSAISDHTSPLNVLGGIPTIATDYSPLWDVNAGEWTKEAINKGIRSRVSEEFQILGLVEQGWITGPGGAKYGSTGFVVNCPIVFRFL